MTLLALATDENGVFHIIQDHHTRGNDYDHRNKTACVMIGNTYVKVGLAGAGIASVDAFDVYKRLVESMNCDALRDNPEDVDSVVEAFERAFAQFEGRQNATQDGDSTVLFAVVHYARRYDICPAWQLGYVYDKEGDYQVSSTTRRNVFRYAWGKDRLYLDILRGLSHREIYSVKRWREFVRNYHRANSVTVFEAVVV